MKHIYITIISFILSCTVFGQLKQQTMNINTDITVDSSGNTMYQMTGKLNAQQWQSWNYTYGGGNASMVKRNIERFLSPYYVYDFKYTPNEMDRTFDIQYKAKGTIEYLGKDKWAASLGMKDAQPVKLSENVFNCVTSELSGNLVIQNTTKCTLPADVSDMQFDKDEFGNVIVKYKRPTESITTVGNSSMKNTGYSLLALGALGLVSLLAFRKKIG